MYSLATLFGACALGAALICAEARQFSKEYIQTKQVEAAQRWENGNAVRTASRTGGGVKNITFSNPKASRESTLR